MTDRSIHVMNLVGAGLLVFRRIEHRSTALAWTHTACILVGSKAGTLVQLDVPGFFSDEANDPSSGEQSKRGCSHRGWVAAIVHEGDCVATCGSDGTVKVALATVDLMPVDEHLMSTRGILDGT